ncbi:MAG: NUDIX domain-containing protein [Candidatus Aenigmatarchaeota archaeon]|nr:NUDIX domain-containing protein [Nanoarchaeota archaeon]
MGNEHFVVAQKAIIKDGNKYLFLKRAPNSRAYPNQWNFPGGKLEIGEESEEGLKRELVEETCLKIKIIEPLFISSEIINKENAVIIAYLCEIVSGEIKLDHESTEYKWMTKEEALKIDLTGFTRAFLEREA